ncbi:NADPH:adrenodoxin oxidoreductase, mitochondrial [Halotydeus destructor]|nr:NADPH:adrenodoxin oxidoreductase, mitochondrial [Halotydeus destructor]
MRNFLRLVRQERCSNVLTKRCLSSLAKPNIKIAVVGSGPAGFYLTQYLLKNPSVAVDIYEKFPVPFGLVRYGVAPDHPDVKNVIHSFTNTATNNRVSFYGNIGIGEDITLKDLRDSYNAVVLCYGSARDRPLNIPGEKLPNVISARQFVGWYNGVPESKNMKVNLSTENVVIIGHGNVALDCARILMSPPSTVLQKTDITSYSLKALQESKVKNVYLVGRRGPLQVAFTIKELREMTKIPGSKTIIDSKDTSLLTNDVMGTLQRPRKRLTELLLRISNESNEVTKAEKKCHIKFFRSPVEINKSEDEKHLITKFVVNYLAGDPTSETAMAIPTEETETIESGLLLKSVGYMTVSIDDSLPMDPKLGVIENVYGRVVDSGQGLYCSGWAAVGPSGVLVNTMNVSFEVGKNILDDIEKGLIPNGNERAGSANILDILQEKKVNFVSFNDWQNIDKMEQSLGEQLGKPREKFVNVLDMLKAAKPRSKE